MKFQLAAFADEADSSVAGQIKAMAENGVACLEIRGEEGLNSLSISNAAYLSTWTGDWAEIPTAEALFEKYLKEQCDWEAAGKK